MTLFQGQLFLGYGDYGCNQPASGHSLLAWDIAKGVIVNYGTLANYANIDMQVVNGQLAVPYAQPSGGTYPNAAFLHSDLATLEVIDGGIRAHHMFGSAYFGGKRYLSGAHFYTISTNGHGVWRDDGGSIGWMQWDGANPLFLPNSYVGSSSSSLRRSYALFVLGSYLYVVHSTSDTAGSLWRTTTGNLGSWSQYIASTSSLAKPHRPFVVGSDVYYLNTNPGWQTSTLYKFDGTSISSFATTIWAHTVGSDGNLYYLDSSMNIKNAAGSTVETAPSNSRSIAYVDGVWYAGTSGSHLHATTPVPQTVVTSTGNVVVDSSGNIVTYS
jgi:hypothetical protein